MSKFSSLLKKVELFEKLAVHGDRKTFLQSLSQTAPSVLPYAGIPTPGSPGTPGGRPLNLNEKLQGGPDPARYIELDQGEGEPSQSPAAVQQEKNAPPTSTPSLTGKPLPVPGSPGTPGGRPLTLAEKLKGPPYPTK